MGLVTMHERAAEIGATITVRGRPGLGSVVQIVWAGAARHSEDGAARPNANQPLAPAAD